MECSKLYIDLNFVSNVNWCIRHAHFPLSKQQARYNVHTHAFFLSFFSLSFFLNSFFLSFEQCSKIVILLLFFFLSDLQSFSFHLTWNSLSEMAVVNACHPCSTDPSYKCDCISYCNCLKHARVPLLPNSIKQ